MLDKFAQQYPSFKRLSQYFCQMIAIVETDVRKLIHDPSELLTRTFQPAIWLLFFGVAMAKAKIVTTQMPYLDYLAPGILAQSILFISIFYGISLIWERDMGILHKILVSPVPRIILVIGRALAAGMRGISQIFVVYVISFFLGVNLRIEFLALLGVLATVLLGCAIFSTFSLIVATIVKKRERFMG
ncbi:MAG: ABC transporter permease, partial [Ignavibacteria bacterium]|nr:ABC transporter permease [Ignavibacteria bacterium]